MKRRLLILCASLVSVNSVLIGGGTYALLTANTSNSGNQLNTLQAQEITIQSFATTDTYDINLPMFYNQMSHYGHNPYDVKTSFIPSGEIPGEWSPGDQVRRTWEIKNLDSAAKISEIYSPGEKFSLKDVNGDLITMGSQAYQDFLNSMRIEVFYPEDSSTPVYSGTFNQLMQAPQPLDTVICFAKGATEKVAFVASMDLAAGNNLQGVTGVLDFQLGAEQVANNCFSPPFSNSEYSMQYRSTTPIKFECYDSYGNLIKSKQENVKLVITGGDLGQGITFSGNDLEFNGGHYQANVYGDERIFSDGVTYTATVYQGSEICGQKTFTTDPGSRSNAS